MLVLTPQCPSEQLACNIMRRILADNLLGVEVSDKDVEGEADVMERSVDILWSSTAFEAISAVIADFMCEGCGEMEGMG